MSSTGDGRDDEERGRTQDAGTEAPDTRVDGEADASPAADTTTPPAEPGPVGPGDTQVISPAVAPSTEAPTSVEPPVGSGSAAEESDTADGALPASAVPADTERASAVPAGTTAADTTPPASEPSAPVAGANEPGAPEPGAPVEDDTDDARSRLDAAVQRANAGAGASAADGQPTPEPVPADSVRRETYVPPAVGGAAVGAATLAAEPQGQQTVYVQAPTPPKPKTNRGFGVLVALIGTVAFALLYAGVAYLLFWGQYGSESTGQYVEFLSRATFYVPIIATFVGFALLAVIVNRGAWWKYAVFGLLVGVLTYFSYIGAVLLVVRAWELTPQEAADVIRPHFLSPLAIAAGVIAREIPIWFGGWIAKRGRGVAERNRLAMEAYDRELAAGPRPTR